MKMFTNITRNLILTTLTLVAAALVTMPSSSVAQEKGAERLLNLNRSAKSAAAVADTPVMSCPKCKDTLVTVAQPPGRGGRVEMAKIVKHQCPACSTKIETNGVGKQATNIVKHGCAMGGGDASCCAVKKS